MCLYAPNLNNLRANKPIVSGRHLQYSRFLEATTRARVGSPLRGVGRSISTSFPPILKRRRGNNLAYLKPARSAFWFCLSQATARRAPVKPFPCRSFARQKQRKL